MSPKSSTLSEAIFRSILRIIFPERVFGNPSVNCIFSGVACGPISALTILAISDLVFSVISLPVLSVTKA